MRILTLTTVALLAFPVAGLAQMGGNGPVYQALEQQGFTHIRTYRDRERLLITAQRGDQTRRLVYDGRNGTLLWDSLDPQRDQTRDQLYLQLFERDRDRLQDMDRDRTMQKDMDQDQDQDQDRDRDRTRDPASHQ